MKDNEKIYFVVAGDEYGLHAQDFDGKKLISEKEAYEELDDILKECDAAAMFKVENGIITLIKDEIIM